MDFKRYAAMSAALAVTIAAAAAAPARGTVFSKDHFEFQDSTLEDDCGIQVRHDFVVSGRFRNRTGKGDLDQAFFGQSTAQFTDTFTNLATKAFFTISGKDTNMDIKARPLGDNVFEFTFRDSGTAVVRDMDGRVVMRDAGAIWFAQVFDTLGDSAPGGDVLAETVLRISGPHPLFQQDDAAFCAMENELIG